MTVIPMPGQPNTPAEARRWVVDRILQISAERHVAVDVARCILHAEMLNDGSRWWGLFGEWLLGEVFRDAIRAGRWGTKSSGVPPHPSSMHNSDDWREDGCSVWDRIVAVGTTGMKRYGDLTGSDLLVISTFYERQASTMRGKAAIFREIAEYLDDGQTLESAEAKLPPRIITFLHDQTEATAKWNADEEAPA